MRTLGSDPRHGGTKGGGCPSAPLGRWRLGLGLGGPLLAGVVSLAFGSVAWSAELTDAEFKCQASVNKAEGKFTGTKVKCVSKCIGNARKGLNSFRDCYYPYGGATATCVRGPLGAENKFAASITKACGPGTPGTDCPDCGAYNINCVGYADFHVQEVENRIDSFGPVGPVVFCDQDGTFPPNATDAETRCELNTAKALGKERASIQKCYGKCFANARKGLIPNVVECTPPATDTATDACISKAVGKASASIDKLCSAVGALPDCEGLTDSYLSGPGWANLHRLVVSSTILDTYCFELETPTTVTSTSVTSTSTTSTLSPTTTTMISLVSFWTNESSSDCFDINTVLDIVIITKWSGFVPNSDHTTEWRVALVGAGILAAGTINFTADSMGMAQTTALLPVGGTVISAHGLVGTWRFYNSLDGNAGSGPDGTFTLCRCPECLP